MSAYTTLKISRKKAIEIMLQKLTDGISDEDLTQFMDRELEPRLYNVRIVNDEDEPNDDACL